MLSLRIAARFIRTSPGQSALIAGGIAVGIATVIFVGSLITNLQASLIDDTIGSAPQITLQNPTTGDPIAFTQRVKDVIYATPGVKQGTVVPVRLASSLYSDGSDTVPLNLVGGELRQLDGIYKISERMVEGTASLRPNEILVGTDFAEKYSVSPGESIQLVFQNGKPADFKVAGIFDLGAAAFNERSAFVNGQVPQDIFGWGSDEYSAIYTQLDQPFESAQIAAEWRRKLPEDEIVDWQSQNADLLSALTSQSASSYMIQSFVLVAVALGIASTLAISAVQKTRQIGILKAMGMGDRPSGRIFLFQALILGSLGAVGGVALAYVLTGLFSLAPLPFSVTPRVSFVILAAAVGVLVALASSIIPTRQTSKLDPIEVIQGG